MSIRTVRFNKQEESMLKNILSYYSKDFSSCIKELITEKLEDLRDMRFVKKIKEGKLSSYLSADQIDRLFKSK